jgi:hypothetical protein
MGLPGADDYLLLLLRMDKQNHDVERILRSNGPCNTTTVPNEETKASRLLLKKEARSAE